MKKIFIFLAAAMLLSIASLSAIPQNPVLVSPDDYATGIPIEGTELVWMQPEWMPSYLYQVYLTVLPGFPEPPIYEGPAMEFFDGVLFHYPCPPLLPTQLYYWRIKVIDIGSGQYSFSETRRFTTGSPPPEPPMLISPYDGESGVPTDGMNLVFQLNDWQYHPDSFFDIFLDTDPSFPNPVMYSGTLTPTRTYFEYHVAALLAEQPYYWFVRYSDFVDNYILDSQVFTFLSSPIIVPSSTITGVVTNNTTYSGTWVYVSCSGACAPAVKKVTFGTTYSFTVNNGLNPVVTPVSPSPLYYFNPSYYQFNNIQTNQTANFTMRSHPPNNVILPIPGQNMANVSININNLKWSFEQLTGYDPPLAFAVYYPASAMEPYAVVPYGGKMTQYSVGIPTLEYSTTYTWKVVPYNDYGEAEGVEVWNFSTQPPPEPPMLISPYDGESGVPTDGMNLVFSLNDYQYHPDSFFDIFLDIDPSFPNPVMYSGTLTPTRTYFEYHVAALLAEQPYYWFVRYSDFVDNYILDSQVFTFLSGPIVIPSSTITGTVTNNTTYSGTWVRVNCSGACAPASLKVTFGATYTFMVNNGLNPIVAPVSPSPLFYFSPPYYQFNNIQSNQTANFSMNSRLPNTVILPVPGLNMTNVSININNLQWSFDQLIGYDPPLAFAVYFPASATEPYAVVPYGGKMTQYSVAIPTLEYSTTYTWKVVPYNDFGEAEGVEVWNFSTQSEPGPPILLYPGNGAPNIPPAGVTLQFEAPGWVIDSFFDIYVDIDLDFPNPPEFSGQLTPVTGTLFEYYLSPMAGEQQYFWRVNHRIGTGVWESAIFTFVTGVSPGPQSTISGNILNYGGTAFSLANVLMSCPAACVPASYTTTITGAYSFKVNNGYDYTVTPAKLGYYFTPLHETFYNVQGNRTKNFYISSLRPGPASLPVPPNLATGVGVGIGLLGWSYVEDPGYALPDGFYVYFPANAHDPYATVAYTREPEYSIPIGPLDYNTPYDWKVVPFNADGWCEYMETWSFVTEEDPFFPSELYVYPDNHQSSVEDAGLIMVWGSPDEERQGWPVDSFFDVYLDTDPDFTGVEPIYSGPGLPSPLNPLHRYCCAPPLQLSTMYYWQIKLTLTGTMETHYSPIWDFTTQQTQVGYPIPLLISPPNQATGVPPRHTQFVWEMGMYPPESFFDVFVSIDPDFPEPPIYTGPGIPVFPYVARWVYEHSLLLDEQAYYWYVRVDNLIDHWYRNSDVNQFTTGGYAPPEPPVLLAPPDHASNVPYESVAFEWTTDPDWWVESFFDVYLDIDPTFPQPPVYSGTGTELLVGGVFTFNQANLLDEEAYYWYVRLTDVLTGLQSYSPVWTFTTASAYLPPPELSIDPDGTLRWQYVPGADIYHIYREEYPGGTSVLVGSTAELFWNDPEYPVLPKAFYYVTAVSLPPAKAKEP
jgi:hypothetical protein